MRKIIVSVINALAIILSGIAFGLGGLTAAWVPDVKPRKSIVGNYYQLLDLSKQGVAAVNIVGFTFFCLAVLLSIVVLVDFKGRKWIMPVSAVLYIVTGALMFKAPEFFLRSRPDATSTAATLGDGLIGMGVLVIIAGALAIAAFVLDIIADRKKA